VWIRISWVSSEDRLAGTWRPAGDDVRRQVAARDALCGGCHGRPERQSRPLRCCCIRVIDLTDDAVTHSGFADQSDPGQQGNCTRPCRRGSTSRGILAGVHHPWHERFPGAGEVVLMHLQSHKPTHMGKKILLTLPKPSPTAWQLAVRKCTLA